MRNRIQPAAATGEERAGPRRDVHRRGRDERGVGNGMGSRGLILCRKGVLALGSYTHNYLKKLLLCM